MSDAVAEIKHKNEDIEQKDADISKRNETIRKL